MLKYKPKPKPKLHADELAEANAYLKKMQAKNRRLAKQFIEKMFSNLENIPAPVWKEATKGLTPALRKQLRSKIGKTRLDSAVAEMRRTMMRLMSLSDKQIASYAWRFASILLREPAAQKSRSRKAG